MTDERFQKLVSEYLDKEISPEGLQSLQQVIAQSPDRLNSFHDAIRLHAAEQALFQDKPAKPLKRVRAGWDNLAREASIRQHFIRNFALGVAVTLALAATYAVIVWPEDAPVSAAVATIPAEELETAKRMRSGHAQLGHYDGTEAVEINLVLSGERDGENFTVTRAFSLLPKTPADAQFLSTYSGESFHINLPETLQISPVLPEMEPMSGLSETQNQDSTNFLSKDAGTPLIPVRFDGSSSFDEATSVLHSISPVRYE